ncbi:MAG: YXWGXW repeat-containing protein [Polyangiales bacterium]
MKHALPALAVAFGLSALAPVASAQVIQVRIRPPAPRQEARPAAPSPRHVWIPGYWAWQNERYDWQDGHYEEPEYDGCRYRPAHWVGRGIFWRFVPGQWSCPPRRQNGLRININIPGVN